MMLRLAAALVGRLSLKRLRFLGSLLGGFVGRVLRIRRRHALDAIQRACLAQPERVVDGVYASLATGAFELLWSSQRTAKELLEVVRVAPSQWAQLDALLAKGRGLIVATAHCGNWDLLGCAVASRVPLAVVTKHLKWQGADAYWQSLRAKRGICLLDSQGALSRSRALLREGHAVAYLIDQTPERSHGTAIGEFLGANVRVDLSFALLALRTRAPLVLVCASREPDGSHRLHILDALEPPSKADKQWAVDTSLRFTAALEGFIRTYPQQWLWLHRRWKGVAQDGATASGQRRVASVVEQTTVDDVALLDLD